jgi:hypothetical protein
MPSLLGDNTENSGGKLKKGKGFLKPNFEPGPNWAPPPTGLTGSTGVFWQRILGCPSQQAANVCFFPKRSFPACGRFGPFTPEAV